MCYSRYFYLLNDLLFSKNTCFSGWPNQDISQDKTPQAHAQHSNHKAETNVMWVQNQPKSFHTETNIQESVVLSKVLGALKVSTSWKETTTRSSVKFFSNFCHLFLVYFDPTNTLIDNTKYQFSG